MARLLFLTPQVPYPPHQGTTIRNYNLIAHLAQDYEVHVLSFIQEGDEPPENSPLARYCALVDTVPAPKRTTAQRLATTLLHPAPDMAHRLSSDGLQARLGMLLEQYRYDAVQIEGIEMAPYGLWLASHPLWRLARVKEDRPEIPIGRPRLVFDDHNAEYVLQQRAWETDTRRPSRWHAAGYSFIQWQKLRRYEAAVCRQADRVVAVSEADRQALLELDPMLQVAVVPNGVDLGYYGAYDRRLDPQPPDYGSHAILFTGKMDFRPNIDAVTWFAEEVLPLVRQQVPEARFIVVGKQPSERVARLGTLPGVTITGWVPDIRAHIAAAEVYVVPMRIGGGTRLKVLEALAMRRAVVSTHVGAEGFPLEGQDALAFADEPARFADTVVELLQDHQCRDRLGNAGRAFVEANYGWQAIVPRMKAVYQELGINP
jgi:glycosyltransferase involved in cell wall biosynthesis